MFACKNWNKPPLLVSSLTLTCLEDFAFVEGIVSSSSDFKILIMTSSKEKLPGPVNAIEVAEAKYKSNSSSKKILKPEVTSAWYIATEIVPTIAKAPNLVAKPMISNQLPPISENAAMYDKNIGNGRCNGLTNASAKFSIFANFSYPWWIRTVPVITLRINKAVSLLNDLVRIVESTIKKLSLSKNN